MTKDEIDALPEDELLAVMRREGMTPVFSLFGTIHMRGPERENGFSEDDLDKISDDLEDGDLRRWRRELADHFTRRGQ